MQLSASWLTKLRNMLHGFILVIGIAVAAHASDTDSRITMGVGVTIPPAWFDPADTPGIVTPFFVLYALHDAVLKPMPSGPLTPSLAERSSASEDGVTYEFTLRAGAKFHSGEPVTAEDVKFSFSVIAGPAKPK